MKNIFIYALILFLSISCKKENKINQPIFFYDEIGNEIRLKSTPKKIISTAPNITEIIFAIGAGNLLVGRTSFCNFPSKVETVQVIGDMLHLNFEKIIELKPDLVFITVEGNTKETYEKLRSLGIEVFVTNPRNIEGILNSIKNISKVLGKRKEGDSLINSLRSRLNRVKESELKKQSAMFVVSFSPLMIAGRNTFIDDIMQSVNLENVAPNSPSSYPAVSRELVLEKNPEWIIVPEDYQLQEIFEYYPEWKNLKAIRQNHIIFIPIDMFFRPGPRFIEAVEFLELNLKSRN